MSSILYYVLLEVQRHVVVISVGLRDLQDHRSSNARVVLRPDSSCHQSLLSCSLTSSWQEVFDKISYSCRTSPELK